MILFAWLVFHNKNLTWDNLIKRGWIGPGICPFCFSAEEDNLHIFFHCRFAQQIWMFLNANSTFNMCHRCLSETLSSLSARKSPLVLVYLSMFYGVCGIGGMNSYSIPRKPRCQFYTPRSVTSSSEPLLPPVFQRANKDLLPLWNLLLGPELFSTGQNKKESVVGDLF